MGKIAGPVSALSDGIGAADAVSTSPIATSTGVAVVNWLLVVKFQPQKPTPKTTAKAISTPEIRNTTLREPRLLLFGSPRCFEPCETGAR